MCSRARVVFGSIVALGLLVQAADPLPAAARGKGAPTPQTQTPAVGAPQSPVPGGAPLKAEQLTTQQFAALPDGAVIEFKGQQTTKAKILAKIVTAKGAKASADQGARQTQAKLEAARSQFAQQQQAKLEAANAKVHVASGRPGTTSQTSQREALRQEALQLVNRARGASPAERVQLEKRAVELLKLLQ